MLDHIMLKVRDFDVSKRFYDGVLGTLGYRALMTFDRSTGFGDQKPYFWIGEDRDPHARMHIAFAAKDRAAVDAFHRAALELGARDNGQPGLRPQYHAHYYGAFVMDPDGHNIEAVCHLPQRSAKKPAARPTKPKAKTAARPSAKRSRR